MFEIDGFRLIFVCSLKLSDRFFNDLIFIIGIKFELKFCQNFLSLILRKGQETLMRYIHAFKSNGQ